MERKVFGAMVEGYNGWIRMMKLVIKLMMIAKKIFNNNSLSIDLIYNFLYILWIINFIVNLNIRNHMR